MEFKKFNTITNMRPERVEEMVNFQVAFGEDRCVVTEKIHGANFTVSTNGSEVEYSRRKDKLLPDEDFYGYQFIVPFLDVKIRAMFEDLKEMSEVSWAAYDAVMEKDGEANMPEIPREISSISVVGEFFGGHYKHPDVKAVEVGCGQVGKGKIWYGQQKSFMAFELRINDVPQDVYQMATLCQSYGIPTVPFLFFGSFDECVAYSKEHLNSPTTVPFMTPLLDKKGNIVEPVQTLPLIEGNIREGHVIMPCYPKWFFNGKRMMLKHKGKSERKERKEPPRLVEFSVAQQAVYDLILDGITEERLENILSKDAYVTKDFPKVIGLVVQDSFEELVEEPTGDFEFCMGMLNTKARKQVFKRLNREAALKLRKAFFAK